MRKPHHGDSILHTISLDAQNTRYQLKIAVALITIVPLLGVTFIALTNFTDVGYSLWTQGAVTLFGAVLAGIGYTMLRRYPDNLERLRDYLRDIARGALPEKVNLLEMTEDVNAIEGYLNTIIEGLREKIAQLEDQLRVSHELRSTIEKQSVELVEAERHRVMVESLGAACHHIGQPATVLRMYVSLLRDEAKDAEMRDKLDACVASVESISGILDKLRRVSEYRTVPYKNYGQTVREQPGDRIVDIETPAVAPRG